MKFSLIIDCDNDAFTEPTDGQATVAAAAMEVSRMLRDLSGRMACGHNGGTIHDHNGNTVGSFEITDEE